jgi:hypothetical protein
MYMTPMKSKYIKAVTGRLFPKWGKPKIEVYGDAKELQKVFSEPNVQLCNASPKTVGMFFDLFSDSTKLFTIEQGTTNRTRILFVFKPTKSLHDALAAIRTGNFERLVVEGKFFGHDITSSKD